MTGARHTDVAIVGGGIIGCSIARALASEGLDVTIVDRAKIGRESSYDAAGMLAPQAEAEQPGPFLDLCLESRDMFATLAGELFDEVGLDVWYRADGTLLLAFDEKEAAHLRARAKAFRGMGLECELLTPSAARRAEPALGPNVAAALSVPGDHQVDNRKLVEAYSLSCFARGVHIIEHAPVRAIARDESGRVSGVDTTVGRIAAETVIVAAGCWSNFVEDFPVPVEPVKGQMLMLEMGSPPCRKVLRSERCYVVARIDGRVLVGATMERVGFDKSVSAKSVGSLLEAGREIAPSLANAFGGEAWAGLRPATPDGLPAIGQLEDGLYAATGHFRNGILLAPVTARIVADAVMDREPHASAAMLDPGRFASRPLA